MYFNFVLLFAFGFILPHIATLPGSCNIDQGNGTPIDDSGVKENKETAIVRVEQGKLRGEKKSTITGDTFYYSFKGIPYAAPPVGNLRFKAPQPALPWKGVRNALEHGSVCPQFEVLRNIIINGSEDCLFLNVYSPSLDKKSRLPVMLVIHGGGFTWGSGDDTIYGPDHLMEKKNIVVVTFNYRLENLGFLCLHTAEVPGNAGMKDQVAALRWVKKNIQSFGGDPNKVTIFGESAGAFCTTYHSLSPMSRGLFQRVIAMSGEPLNDFIIEFDQQRKAFQLAKSLGFEAENTTSLLEFLQTVPATQLVNTTASIIAAEAYMTVKFLSTIPVVEKDFGQERFLIEIPEVSVKKGRSDVDILLGHTSAEGVFFITPAELTLSIEKYGRYPEVLTPRRFFYDTTPKQHLKIADLIREYYTGSELQALNMPQFANYITDSFVYPIIRYANLLSKYSKNDNIYLYEFDRISERNVYYPVGIKYGINGTSHFDDLKYIFEPKLYNFPVNKDGASYRMIRETCALISNFVVYGNPTPDASLGITWPKYNPESKMFLSMGNQLELGTDPRRSTMDFYDRIFKLAGYTINKF